MHFLTTFSLKNQVISHSENCLTRMNNFLSSAHVFDHWLAHKWTGLKVSKNKTAYSAIYVAKCILNGKNVCVGFRLIIHSLQGCKVI